MFWGTKVVSAEDERQPEGICAEAAHCMLLARVMGELAEDERQPEGMCAGAAHCILLARYVGVSLLAS